MQSIARRKKDAVTRHTLKLLGARPLAVLGIVSVVALLSAGELAEAMPFTASLVASPAFPLLRGATYLLAIGVALLAAYKWSARLGIAAVSVFMAMHIPYSLAGLPAEAPGLLANLSTASISIMAVLFIDDVHRNKRSAQRVSQAWEDTFESATELVSVHDADFRILRVNKAFAQYFEMDPQDIIGKKCYQLVHGLDGPHPLCPFVKILTTHQPCSEEFFETHLGVYLRCSASPIFNNNREVEGCVHSLKDVTAEKQSEQNLLHLASFPEMAPMLICEVDSSGMVKYVNPACDKSFPSLAEAGCTHPYLAGLQEASEVKLTPENNSTTRQVNVDQRCYEQIICQLDALESGRTVRVYGLDVTGLKLADEALRKSEQFNTSLLENAPNPITVTAADTSVLYVNPAFEELTGFSSAEVAGKKFPYPWWPADLAEAYDLNNGLPPENRPEVNVMERIYQKKNGETFPVQLSIKDVMVGDEIQYSVSNWVDLTRLRRVEESLKESEHRFHRLADATSEGIAISENGIMLDANQRLAEMLHYDISEIIGRKILDFVVPEYRDRVQQIISLRSEDLYEVVCLRKDGSTFPVEARGRMLDQRGRTLRIATLRDITGRKQAEEVLRQSEEKYRSLINNVKLGIFRSTPGPDGRFLEVNKAMEDITGYSRDELLEMDVSSLYAQPEERGKVIESLDSANGGTTKELHFRKKDGTKIIVADTKTPVPGKKGRVAYFDGILEDITGRKQMEDELEAEARLLNAATDGIILHDDEGKIAYFNEAAHASLGYSREEMAGLTVPELLSPKERGLYTQGVKLFGSVENAIFETKGESKDGAAIPVEVHSSRVEIRGARYILSVIRDISERRQMEEQLEREAYLLNAAMDSIFLCEPRGKIVYFNDAACDLLGYTRDEFTQLSQLDLPSSEAFQRFVERIGHIEPDGEIIFESEERRKDGSPVTMEVIARSIEVGGKRYILSVGRDISERKRVEGEIARFKTVSDLATYGIVMLDSEERIIYANKTCGQLHGYEPEEMLGRPCTMFVPEEEQAHVNAMFDKSEQTGGFVDEEVVHIRKDGTTFPVLMTGVTVKSEDGQPLYTSVLFVDVTDRKKMQAQLLVTDRLASLGQLVSGVAHEINNPLTGVIGFSDLLLQRELPEGIRSDLMIVFNEAQRATKVVRNLLTFARKQPQEKKLTSVNEAIERVMEVRAYEQTTNNIKVDTHLADNLPPVMANSSQLQQVFFNIIINAEFFMREAHGKGTLNIVTERHGEFIRVSFADDGPGISREGLLHLFNPFFTTKEVGKGTGLGMSISQGIVSEHGGRIWAESEVGKGATFIVELPISCQR